MSSKVGLTPSSTSPMVRELLNQDNYAEWHVWMKNYLLGQDLWDVIVEVQSPDCDIDTAEFKSWKRKNAAALHAIHMSCGSEALSVTMENDITAKKAWDALYNKYRSMATCLELDEDKSADIPDINDYAQDATFYKALQEGKWEAAKDFIDTHRDTLNRRIAPFGKTVLHAAVEFGHFNIMKELLKLMSKEAIEIRDNEGDTTLATLTSAGSIEMAKWVVKRNKNVLTIANNRKWIPVSLAIKYRHIEMARYLYSVTPFEELVGEKETYGATLLCQCYYLRLMDMALDLVKRCPDFAIAPDNFDRTLVLRLATIPSAFPSGSNLSFWQQWIYDWIQIKPSSSANHVQLNIDNDDQRRECDENIIVHPCLRERLISDIHNFLGIKKIYQMKLDHEKSLELLRIVCKKIETLSREQMSNGLVYDAIFRAAERGISEFIIESSKANPDLLWCRDKIRRNLFFYAIQFRQSKVFSLIFGYEKKDALVSSLDSRKNNMLHVAGELAPLTELNRISDAALQMQRELQWFKEVESIVPPYMQEALNIDKKTPRDVFTENHKELVKEGERWMKETASSCTVVGALIVTIMFAAAFTFPGGNNDNGSPIFLNHKLFMLFMISDAISLFSSSTSVLMFLRILTSRYAEEDFLESLPKRLMIGLSALFFSIATMMITFCAAMYFTLHGQSWIFIPVTLLATIPVTLFMLLQFPPLVQIFNSTYRPVIFNREVNRWF
ncbi:Ankyrin repeat-containing protein [Quillaja saponaria]|uniref:Ankyrin repeat-containing protein n=1 Tax=Quillaja saponaria TaxID=32244 RepID=A0AAD7VGF0_QUISA|nr:Ankyrin repeat-containing protein [Quillaja saponaria]